MGKLALVTLALAASAFGQYFPPGGGGGGGSTIPSTTNVIKGNGSGNGADSKVAFTAPATAATIQFAADNETVVLPAGTMVPTTRTVCGSALSANVNCTRAITLSIDGGGSVITTGAVGQFQSVKFACTINQVDISSDQSGSITIDVWKVNAAIPTATNKISASAPMALSSAQIALGTLDISSWTKTVSSGDVFGFSIATAATVTKTTATIWCN